MKNEVNYQEERFDSFINKIIIFSSKNYFKKQMNTINKEKTIVDDENYSTFLQDFINSNSYTDNNTIEISLHLNRAIESLSSIEKSVIFLLFQEDLSQEEAAKVLEICSRSVSRIKIRAIEKLKNYLIEGGFENEK